MAARFGKDPIEQRAGTSVQIKVSFPWYGGKNRNRPLLCDYGPYGEEQTRVSEAMRQKAKDFWKKFNAA